MATASNQPKFTLNNGLEFPKLGLGTWQGREKECEEMVYQAIKIGFRHIDTAAIYDNETEVGIGIQRAIDEGLVKRDELFIVTKCWNDRHGDVEAAMKGSLQRLGLQYVDLYLVHWPIAWKKGSKIVDETLELDNTWKQMELLVENGFTRSIGVSNYNPEQIEHLVSIAKIKPVVNQVEIHPYFNNFKLQQCCNKHNIYLTAYSALMPKSTSYITEWRDMAADPIVIEIATKHQVSPQQVLLRWNIDVGNTVIVKSSKLERLQQNFNILNFQLDQDDLTKLNSFTPIRYRNPHDFLLPKEEFFFKDE